jgi:hypothetical protein
MRRLSLTPPLITADVLDNYNRPAFINETAIDRIYSCNSFTLCIIPDTKLVVVCDAWITWRNEAKMDQ